MIWARWEFVYELRRVCLLDTLQLRIGHVADEVCLVFYGWLLIVLSVINRWLWLHLWDLTMVTTNYMDDSLLRLTCIEPLLNMLSGFCHDYQSTEVALCHLIQAPGVTKMNINTS